MKPLIIVGKMGSGKTITAKLLEDMGYHRGVTYTTRPKREGEIEGVDYYFISEEDFRQKIKEDFFAEYDEYDASFGHCYYGSSKEMYSENKLIAVLNIYGLHQIKDNGIQCRAVYLNVSNETIRHRIIERGDDSIEVDRRLEKDEKDFSKDNLKGYIDYIVDIPSIVNPKTVAQVIYQKENPPEYQKENKKQKRLSISA